MRIEEINLVNGLKSGLVNSLYSVIVQVRLILKRTVVGDCRFDNLSGRIGKYSSECERIVTYFEDFRIRSSVRNVRRRRTENCNN